MPFSNESFVSISGAGIHEAIFDVDNDSLLVNGTDMNYTAWLDIGVTGYEHFFLKGEHQNAFRLYTSETGVATEGVSGKTECGFSSKKSISVDTIQLNFAETSNFDLSNLSRNSIQFTTGDGQEVETLTFPTSELVSVGDRRE